MWTAMVRNNNMWFLVLFICCWRNSMMCYRLLMWISNRSEIIIYNYTHVYYTCIYNNTYNDYWYTISNIVLILIEVGRHVRYTAVISILLCRGIQIIHKRMVWIWMNTNHSWWNIIYCKVWIPCNNKVNPYYPD